MKSYRLQYMLAGVFLVGNLFVHAEVIDGYEMYIVHPYRNAETLDLLRERLTAADPTLRVETPRDLAYINDPADTERVQTYLEDVDPRVRAEALRALARMKSQGSIPAAQARALARDGKLMVRRAFFTHLGELRVSNPESLVREGLKDPDPEGRTAAGTAAAGLPALHDELFAALKMEQNPVVRRSIFESMLTHPNRLRKDVLAWGAGQDEFILMLLIKHLQPDDTFMRDRLMGWLDHPVDGVAEGAFDTAARLQWEKVVPKALFGLSGTGNMRDMTLIRVLGSFERVDTRAALAETALRNPERLGSNAACARLVAWKSAETTDALIPLTASDHLEVKIAAARELGQRHAVVAAPTLCGMLHEENLELLGEVVNALVLIDFPEKPNFLKRYRELAAYRHGRVKAGAFRLRGQLNDRTQLKEMDHVVINISWDDPYEPRLAAWEVLRQWKVDTYYARAIDFLTVMVIPPPPMGLPSYDHDLVRMEAMGYLMDFRRPQTAQELMSELKDLEEMPSRWLRVKLAKAYTELTGNKYVPLPDHSFVSYRVESLLPYNRRGFKIPGFTLESHAPKTAR